MSCESQKELLLIRFVLLGYKYGAKVTGLTVQPDVCALWKTVRAVRNEAHCYLEFLRFSDLGGFLVGELAPKNTVLPLIAGHFCDRLPEEDFVLYDRTHAMGFFHRRGGQREFFHADKHQPARPRGGGAALPGPFGRASTGPSPSRAEEPQAPPQHDAPSATGPI